ncbi:hypothetical protein [Endozoicomonas ascidiicola]|uniref:hypothetical protein n=1 Tax=Endozoicomonas ascidiicola TaxID=1698521 RepID=UPI0008299EA6|nr:hypothetical protein [Endozoicomonas ascidiicola]
MTISYNGDSAGTLSKVANLDQAYYDQTYRPLNREIIGSINSTELVDAAKNNANASFEQGEQRSDRMLERYGMNLNSLEQAEDTRRSASSKSLNYDNVVNGSRMAQYDRNVGLRNEMISIGRGIDNSAHNQLQNAAGLQTQRENANRQIEAQNKSAKYSNMAAGASAGMAGAYAMGLAAGPIGWAAVGGAMLFSMF